MSIQFTIYCHTNRANGKRYVGQTAFTMEKRWGDHVSAAKVGARRSAFANAIRKYGADAFDHQILEISPTQEEANSAETRWIAQLNSQVPSGYNLKSGGSAHGHHGDTKCLIGESQRARWQNMTAEERIVARRPMAESLRSWWRKLTAKEYEDAKSSRAEGLRSRWEKMTSGERSFYQKSRHATRSPERRSASAIKSWDTRRLNYGQSGVRRTKSPEEHGAAIKKGWASMSPEARAERVQKIKDGVRFARESRAPRLIRINLLFPALQ